MITWSASVRSRIWVLTHPASNYALCGRASGRVVPLRFLVAAATGNTAYIERRRAPNVACASRWRTCRVANPSVPTNVESHASTESAMVAVAGGTRSAEPVECSAAGRGVMACWSESCMHLSPLVMNRLFRLLYAQCDMPAFLSIGVRH